MPTPKLMGFVLIEENKSGNGFMESACLAAMQFFRSHTVYGRLAFFMSKVTMDKNSGDIMLEATPLLGYPVIKDKDIPIGYIAFGEIGE